MATFTKPFYALLFLARLTSVIVAVLVLIWAFRFRTSFLLPSSSKTDTVYSVLHPLVMVIGFILVSGEAILIHKALPSWSRNFKKSLHLFLQAVALGLGFFGIWIKFYKYKGFANFYSLHSWMGLICMCLFVSQWIVGFMSFWHRGEVRGVRVYVLPWHVFVGLYTYALSVATAETGLLEKLTFLQGKGLVLRNSPESMVVNFLGLGLSLLGALVILAAVCQNPTNIAHIIGK
ncbi:probable transmembrane ascorbate ferrireductase 4 isoform X2 [Nymphaea colorata]|nr:probable transmembrane ascorbate ferrireductase 4 isoform X2 [Nymphaea colorata]